MMWAGYGASEGTQLFAVLRCASDFPCLSQWSGEKVSDERIPPPKKKKVSETSSFDHPPTKSALQPRTPRFWHTSRL